MQRASVSPPQNTAETFDSMLTQLGEPFCQTVPFPHMENGTVFV